MMSEKERKDMAFVIDMVLLLLCGEKPTGDEVQALENIAAEYPEVTAKEFRY